MSALLPHALLDLLLPPSCPACAAIAWVPARGALCAACAVRLPSPCDRCPACGRLAAPHRVGLGCPRCSGPQAERDALAWSGARDARRRRAVDGVVAAHAYGGVPRDLVLALKFRTRPEAARPLAADLAEALRRARIPGDLLVPVPLSAARRRARGYNQAALLARAVGRDLGLEVDARALLKRRHTAPQATRSRVARRRGPRGAFCARPRRVAGRSVLLVDDVLTSGATARACALALRRAGATGVIVAVACRAERA